MIAFFLLALGIVACTLPTMECPDDVVCEDYGYPNITLCFNDGNTYEVPYNYLPCYFGCLEIQPLYPGECGCPNDCSAAIGGGYCEPSPTPTIFPSASSPSQCVCNAGFGGQDCSVMTECHFHGEPVDGQCVCDDGWGGASCDVPLQTVPMLPEVALSGAAADVFPNDDYGDDHPVFNRSRVATLNVTIDPDDFLTLMEPANFQDDTYYVADVTYTNGLVSFAAPLSGFRLHGFSSRKNAKKNFSIKFDKFVDDQVFYDIPKINMCSGADDPTFVRSRLSTDMYRSLGLATPRSAYAELYVNGIYFGAYYALEAVGKEFYTSRFDNHKGNAYKCRSGASMNYLGDDPDLYRYDMSGEFMGQEWQHYELLSDDDADRDPYADLAAAFGAMNQTIVSDGADTDDFEDTFNTDAFVRALIAEITTCQVDGYGYNGNNFRMYHNKDTGRLEFIAYDFDVSLGNAINFREQDIWGFDWDRFDIYAWGLPHFSQSSITQGTRSGYIALYESDAFVGAFADYFADFLDSGYNIHSGDIEAVVAASQAMAYVLLAKDQFHPLIWGFTMDEFASNLEQPLVRTVTDPATGEEGAQCYIRYGLLPFIETRWMSAHEQL
eukprot:gnl/Chilomastix_cuspidata/784.p1 GENE.gnl/Chilomastix_cuspidata/784~~gnl/Chilomastix_cuspidata/784.p1  ORF type:complete len:608 (-),score=230.60 gnl/Chilomastix_cuspidata/784:30-1853(-)